MPKVTEQIVTQLLAICTEPLANILKSGELKYKFGLAYQAWAGNKLCCEEAIPNAYETLQLVIKQFKNRQMKTASKSNYQLKKGKILFSRKMNKMISEANLTDENAKAMLDEHPAWAQHFDVIPSTTPAAAAEPEQTDEEKEAAAAADQKAAEEKAASAEKKVVATKPAAPKKK